MALACDPELLLLDEPTAGMDKQESKNTMKLIQDLSDQHSILLVEHDIEIVMEVSDIIDVLHRGEIIANGNPQSIKESQKVQEVYLGRDIHA